MLLEEPVAGRACRRSPTLPRPVQAGDDASARCASRRTSSRAPSISTCSKRSVSASSDCGGQRRYAPAPGCSASRPSRSNSAQVAQLEAPAPSRWTARGSTPMRQLQPDGLAGERFDAADANRRCAAESPSAASATRQEHAPQQQHQPRPRPRGPPCATTASGAARRHQTQETRVRPFGVRAFGASHTVSRGLGLRLRSRRCGPAPHAARTNLAQRLAACSMGSGPDPSTLAHAAAPPALADAQPLRAAHPPPLCRRAAAAAAGPPRRRRGDRALVQRLRDGGPHAAVGAARGAPAVPGTAGLPRRRAGGAAGRP